jgi:DNA-binding transcriptional LysR family regulator
MEEHALAAESSASGRSVGITGVVRITASEWMIRSLLGPGLEPLLTRHGGLTIELSADPRHLSLVRREADLALRPSEFTHQEIVQRELAELSFGLYASDSYLARHGVPDFAAGAEGHVFVQMTDGLANLADYEWLPTFASGARVAVRTNGREPMATMASAGIGIACLPRILGDRTRELRLLKTPVPSPRRKLYLGVHRAARKTPRVRVVMDFVVQLMEKLKGALCPEG